MYKAIAFIGAGHLAVAMVEGLIQAGYPSHKLYLTRRNSEKGQALAKQLQVNYLQNNQQAARKAEIIVIAVKPGQVKSVCQEINVAVQEKHKLIISLAAGVSIAYLQQCLAGYSTIIRAMPNTPCAINYGAAALYSAAHVAPEDKALAQDIFAKLGSLVWLEEEESIDVATALVGSGPAFVYLFMGALQNAAEKLGLPKALSTQLAPQMMRGAVNMVLKDQKDVLALIKSVASAKGTTQQGLQVLMDNHFDELIQAALSAAHQRTKTLAKELL